MVLGYEKMVFFCIIDDKILPSIVKPVYAPEISQSDAKSPGINFQCILKDAFWVLSFGGAFQLEVFGLK